MQEVRTILFPTDFSANAENAFRYCLRLADDYGAKIEVIHVLFPEYEGMDLAVLAAQATHHRVIETKELLKLWVEHCMAQVQTTYSFKNPPIVTSRIEVGQPSGTITRFAQREAIDMVLMGTKSEHSILEKTFGSVTTHVIEHINCPVLVIPQQAIFRPIHVVVYATDLVESDPYHIWKIGKWFDPFMPIMHCVHVNIEKSIDKLMEFSEMSHYFDNRTPVLQLQFEQIPGENVAECLELYTEKQKADVLVMYAPHHNIWNRIFHRSQTKKMAYETHIPLLIYKD